MRLIYVFSFLLLSSTASMAFDASHVDKYCDQIDIRSLRISCQAAVDRDENLCNHIESDYDRNYCIKVVRSEQ